VNLCEHFPKPPSNSYNQKTDLGPYFRTISHDFAEILAGTRKTAGDRNL